MIAYIQFTKMEEKNMKKSSKANCVQIGKWGRYDHICEKKMIANIWAGHRWSSGGGEGEWVVGPEAPAWELGLSAACSNLIVVFELYFFYRFVSPVWPESLSLQLAAQNT